MKRTLHKLAGESLFAYTQTERSHWLLEWPGQLVLNISQVLRLSSEVIMWINSISADLKVKETNRIDL